MIDFCCACISSEECGCEHDCNLSREEIDAANAAHEELMDVYASLKVGEKKQVPSTGRWVTLTIGKNPAGGECREYGFCDE